jgi:hypothetical protein
MGYMIKEASKAHGALGGAALGGAAGSILGGGFNVSRQAIKNRKNKNDKGRRSLSDAFITGAIGGGVGGAALGGVGGAVGGHHASAALQRSKDKLKGQYHDAVGKAKGQYHAGAEQIKTDAEQAGRRAAHATTSGAVTGLGDGTGKVIMNAGRGIGSGFKAIKDKLKRK